MPPGLGGGTPPPYWLAMGGPGIGGAPIGGPAMLPIGGICPVLEGGMEPGPMGGIPPTTAPGGGAMEVGGAPIRGGPAIPAMEEGGMPPAPPIMGGPPIGGRVWPPGGGGPIGGPLIPDMAGPFIVCPMLVGGIPIFEGGAPIPPDPGGGAPMGGRGPMDGPP